MSDDTQKVTINDEEVSKEQLQEVKKNLKKDERLTEVNPGEYRKLKRLKE